jgi:hypothetical protein
MIPSLIVVLAGALFQADGQPIATAPQGSAIGAAVFTPNGKVVAFSIKRDGKEAMVIQGAIGEEFESIREILLSQDGSTVAYHGRKGKTSFMVSGTTKSDEYSSVFGPVLSADGKILAYKATTFRDRKIECFLVNGGTRDGPHPWVSRPALSPDGRSVGYLVQASPKGYAVINGVRGPEFDFANSTNPPVFSPDNRFLAFGGRVNRKDVGVIGDSMKEFPSSVDRVIFGPTSDRVAYQTGGTVVLDGLPGEKFIYVQDAVLGPDGKSLHYIGCHREDDRKFSVVSNGTKAGPYRYVAGLTASPQGNACAYAASIEKEWYLVAGAERFGPYDSVGTPVFSPDGRLVACAVKPAESPWRVKCGPSLSEPYDGVGPLRFSADGNTLLFGAWKNGKLWWKEQTLK